MSVAWKPFQKLSRCPAVAQLNLHSPATETQAFPHDALQLELWIHQSNKYVEALAGEHFT